jgi:hypothetical protein
LQLNPEEPWNEFIYEHHTTPFIDGSNVDWDYTFIIYCDPPRSNESFGGDFTGKISW